ncbi:hypothetical protein HY061_03450 [Candidatus Azambacteria bacterium]|nr:hypothetical protein [Candidatus Azambacteria bacterium]
MGRNSKSAIEAKVDAYYLLLGEKRTPLPIAILRNDTEGDLARMWFNDFLGHGGFVAANNFFHEKFPLNEREEKYRIEKAKPSRENFKSLRATYKDLQVQLMKGFLRGKSPEDAIQAQKELVYYIDSMLAYSKGYMDRYTRDGLEIQREELVDLLKKARPSSE